MSISSEVINYLESSDIGLKVNTIQILEQLLDDSHEVEVISSPRNLELIINLLKEQKLSHLACNLLTNLIAVDISILERINIINILAILESYLTVSEENISTYLMLLSNITLTENNSSLVSNYFFMESSPKHKNIEAILIEFLAITQVPTTSGPDINWNDTDPWQYMSNVICNLSREELSRNFFFQRSNNFRALLPHVRSLLI